MEGSRATKSVLKASFDNIILDSVTYANRHAGKPQVRMSCGYSREKAAICTVLEAILGPERRERRQEVTNVDDPTRK